MRAVVVLFLFTTLFCVCNADKEMTKWGGYSTRYVRGRCYWGTSALSQIENSNFQSCYRACAQQFNNGCRGATFHEQTRRCWLRRGNDNSPFTSCTWGDFAFAMTATQAQAENKVTNYVHRAANCVSWGDPHYVSFDGRVYDWYGVGEYVMYKTALFDEQINTMVEKPHNGYPVSFNTGMAMRVGTHSASVQFWSPTHHWNPRIFVDGAEVPVHPPRVIMAGNDLEVHIHHMWSGHHIVSFRNRVSHTRVTARGYNYHVIRYMNVRVHLTGYDRNIRSEGMCGSYDQNAMNDYVTAQGHQVHHAWQFVPTFAVPAANSIFRMRPSIRATTAAESQHLAQMSLRDVAKGDENIVRQALHACRHLPHPRLQKECGIDFIAGLRKQAAATARQAVNDFQNGKWIERAAECNGHGDPHYLTFDGRTYDYYGEGEYVMYKSRHLKEKVNVISQKQFPQSPVSWHRGVAMRSGSDTIAIRLIGQPRDFNLQLMINGKVETVRAGASYNAGSLRLQAHRPYPGNHAFTITNVVSRTRVVVWAFFWHGNMAWLNVHVHVAGYWNKEHTKGLCGTYDRDRNNDFRLRNGQTTQDHARFALDWFVPQAKTLFGANVPVIAKPTLQLVRRADRATPLKLAGGDRQKVAKARQACINVPRLARNNCIKDVVVGASPRAVVREAKHVAKAIIKDTKPRARIHVKQIANLFQDCNSVVRLCANRVNKLSGQEKTNCQRCVKFVRWSDRQLERPKRAAQHLDVCSKILKECKGESPQSFAGRCQLRRRCTRLSVTIRVAKVNYEQCEKQVKNGEKLTRREAKRCRFSEKFVKSSRKWKNRNTRNKLSRCNRAKCQQSQSNKGLCRGCKKVYNLRSRCKVLRATCKNRQRRKDANVRKVCRKCRGLSKKKLHIRCRTIVGKCNKQPTKKRQKLCKRCRRLSNKCAKNANKCRKTAGKQSRKQKRSCKKCAGLFTANTRVCRRSFWRCHGDRTPRDKRLNMICKQCNKREVKCRNLRRTCAKSQKSLTARERKSCGRCRKLFTPTAHTCAKLRPHCARPQQLNALWKYLCKRCAKKADRCSSRRYRGMCKNPPTKRWNKRCRKCGTINGRRINRSRFSNRVRRTGRRFRAGVRRTGRRFRAGVRRTGRRFRAGVRRTGRRFRDGVRRTGRRFRAGVRRTGRRSRDDTETEAAQTGATQTEAAQIGAPQTEAAQTGAAVLEGTCNTQRSSTCASNRVLPGSNNCVGDECWFYGWRDGFKEAALDFV